MVYIVRGLPGSGKSTFAQTLANSLSIPYIEADQYFYKDGVYEFDATKLHLAHQYCFDTFCANAKSGCIVSNTFIKEKYLKPYIDYCIENNIQYTVLIVENRHGNKNVHNVPDDVVDNMKKCFSVKL